MAGTPVAGTPVAGTPVAGTGAIGAVVHLLATAMVPRLRPQLPLCQPGQQSTVQPYEGALRRLHRSTRARRQQFFKQRSAAPWSGLPWWETSRSSLRSRPVVTQPRAWSSSSRASTVSGSTAKRRDSSDVWNQTDVLSLLHPAQGPQVQVALAESHRVCSYDRPGTLRYIEGGPLTDRSTPVPQPRTAADIVAELHTLLTTAAVPEPYVLVGHSLGGLMARLYAQTYPEQIAGVVFVDAFSPTVPQVFGTTLWPIYRDKLLNPPLAQAPLPSLRSPDSERVDLDASSAQVLAAPALPATPLAVLTKTESFGGLGDVPGLPAAVTNRLFEQAQDSFLAMAPATSQIIATGSDHYIQFSQPDLIVSATELVMARAAKS